MAKYTTVYVRNKKQSSISLPLRYSFLRSIFVQNMSVKDAASKWKIHYSSAKFIARTARRNKLHTLFEKDNVMSTPVKQCCYRDIEDPEAKNKMISDEKESDHSNNGDSLTHFSSNVGSKIQIHSTIGWNFNLGFLEATQ